MEDNDTLVTTYISTEWQHMGLMYIGTVHTNIYIISC